MADARAAGLLSRPPFTLAAHHVDLAAGGEAMALSPLDQRLVPALAAAFAAMEPWSVYPYPESALATYLAGARPDAPVFAITVAGAVTGAAGLRLDWLRGPYIQFLGLLHDAQGAGIGAAVLGWIEAEARRSGARNLWVAASDFNAGALRFYSRHGFRPVADLPGLVRDDRTEVLLRKQLTDTSEPAASCCGSNA